MAPSVDYEYLREYSNMTSIEIALSGKAHIIHCIDIMKHVPLLKELYIDMSEREDDDDTNDVKLLEENIVESMHQVAPFINIKKLYFLNLIPLHSNELIFIKNTFSDVNDMLKVIKESHWVQQKLAPSAVREFFSYFRKVSRNRFCYLPLDGHEFELLEYIYDYDSNNNERRNKYHFIRFEPGIPTSIFYVKDNTCSTFGIDLWNLDFVRRTLEIAHYHNTESIEFKYGSNMCDINNYLNIISGLCFPGRSLLVFDGGTLSSTHSQQAATNNCQSVVSMLVLNEVTIENNSLSHLSNSFQYLRYMTLSSCISTRNSTSIGKHIDIDMSHTEFGLFQIDASPKHDIEVGSSVILLTFTFLKDGTARNRYVVHSSGTSLEMDEKEFAAAKNNYAEDDIFSIRLSTLFFKIFYFSAPGGLDFKLKF